MTINDDISRKLKELALEYVYSSEKAKEARVVFSRFEEDSNWDCFYIFFNCVINIEENKISPYKRNDETFHKVFVIYYPNKNEMNIVSIDNEYTKFNKDL